MLQLKKSENDSSKEERAAGIKDKKRGLSWDVNIEKLGFSKDSILK